MSAHRVQSAHIAIDASCAAESPVTGIGYAAIYQMRALLAKSDPRFHFTFFASGDQNGREILRREMGGDKRLVYVPRARLAKYYAWTRLNWPPIEWFTGAARIAHNLCHQTPATSRALKLVTVHDLSAFRHPETHTPRMVTVQRTLLRHSARYADRLIAVSQHCADELQEVLSVPADKISVIPNGVNIGEFDRPFDDAAFDNLKLEHDIKRDYLIHVGTIEPRKNLLRLLEAYRIAAQQGDDFPQLVLVGAVGWNADPILTAIHEMKGNVLRPGYLTRAEVILLLRGARACIYPSLYEGFGLPVLEAMAARTPVVTSQTTALPGVAGDAAFYIDPMNVDSIAHALAEIVVDSDELRRRVEAGRRRAEQLSWEASASKLASLYESLAH
ncbi:MAG TPA: glycosyltransferase family 1 protein [Candidatus Hydrogenedentes bacterium]|nr:glycosyltransferase family 1 protein [Candidatus Hydrogenedentota bacterium]